MIAKLQAQFAFDSEDTEDIRAEKVAIFLVAGSCCLAGLVWTAMYYFIFGISIPTLLPFLFVIIVGSSLIVSHLTKNHHYAIYAQIICIIYITVLIQWSIGGVFDSGFVMIWSFIGPMVSLMFFSLRKSSVWFVLFLVNLLLTVLFNEFFSLRGPGTSETIRLVFFTMNLGVAALVVFIFAGYFVKAAVDERERANNLLLNVLPKKIANRLKLSDQTIADRFDSVSVLFADIVGSTPLFAELEPAEVVDWLNDVFSLFDQLVDKYDLEKIRTIGDNYMVASGVPTPRPDHAAAIANLALDMIHQLKTVPPRNGKRIEFRIGINSGPLVAGVIGKSRFHYDLWGDTANVASRMESHGEVGKIQITQSTYELIKGEFECVPRGPIEIKGKGKMETWFLVGRKKAQ